MYPAIKFEKLSVSEYQNLLKDKEYLILYNKKIYYQNEVVKDDVEYLLIKKVNLNYTNIKQLCYAFISANGFYKNIFIDLILKQYNKRMNFIIKQVDFKGKLDIKTYTRDEVLFIWNK